LQKRDDKEVTAQRYAPTPERYVSAEEVENYGKPFDQRIQRSVRRLAEQLNHARKLKEPIRKIFNEARLWDLINS